MEAGGKGDLLGNRTGNDEEVNVRSRQLTKGLYRCKGVAKI